MNLVLVFPEDFVSDSLVRLTGRRFDAITRLRNEELTLGVDNGRIRRGRITSRHSDAVELEVTLDHDPSPPLPVTLVLALPRPKVLNRVIAGAASMGVKRIFLVNAWRVEKSYWKSPRLSPENLRAQSILGLEQARDTVLPSIETRRLFRPFVESELPPIAANTVPLVAHPQAIQPCPRDLHQPVTLVVGPEGGFIDEEIASLQRIGFAAVSVGARILRVETAVAALLGRLL